MQSMGETGILPVSPDDSMTVIPLRPIMPMRLQTRMAYSLGTVYTILSAKSARGPREDAAYLFVVSV